MKHVGRVFLLICLLLALLAPQDIRAGTTTHYGWNYGTEGQDPWWDVWVNIFGAIDLSLFNGLGAKAPINSPTFTGTVTFPVTGGTSQCLHVSTAGVLSGTGSDCGAGGAGDITDVWGCTSGNCNSLTAASGDSMDGTAGDVIWPFKAGMASNIPGTCTANKGTYWSTDTGCLYLCTATDTWTSFFCVGSDGTYSLSAKKNTSYTCASGTTSGYLNWDVNGNPYSCYDSTNSKLPKIVASGAVTNDSGSITSGQCSSAIDGGTATGVATTDRITWNFNGDPTGITGFAPSASGGLFIYAYPTADHVNFKICNNTGGAVDPGSITLNWMVLK